MNEQKQKNSKAPVEKNAKAMNGRDKEETSVWEKVAATIAGDNKLLGSILKIALSPLGMIAILFGFGWLFWKNSQLKDKITKLEMELLQVKAENKGLQEEIDDLEEEQEKKASEKEQELQGINYVPIRQLPRGKVQSRSKTIHLD